MMQRPILSLQGQMMSKNGEKRIDAPTGTETVGHEWDGIEELNTPLPRWWLWAFYLSIIWAIGYVIAYPAWPMVDRATKGVLQWSSRGELAKSIKVADNAQQGLRDQLAATPVAALREDPALFRKAVAGGFAAFKLHCSQCHGSGAAGSQTLGYPNLTDDDWLWGGDLDAIHYSINHGIRQAQDNDCAACHGANGGGDRSIGAPRLNDAIWLRGNSKDAIKQQILYPKMGIMPAWGERLDAVTVKMLTAYVHSRGGGEQSPVKVAEQAEAATDQAAADNAPS
jgi:cytochrome c oxidase cbb3-type subunit 3